MRNAMKNLISGFWGKIISLFIINSFLLLDIAWAGNMDLGLSKNKDTLAAPIQISGADFLNTFLKIKIQVSAEIFYIENGQIHPQIARINALIKEKKQQQEKPDISVWGKIQQSLNKVFIAGHSGRTNGLQSNYLSTLCALAISCSAQLKLLLIQNISTIFMALGWGGIFIVSGFLLKRLSETAGFIRLIKPLRVKWYVWRLGLDKQDAIDQFVLEMIKHTENRQDLIKRITTVLKHLQDIKNKAKNGSNPVNSEGLLDKRLRDILFGKLFKMGTDAAYFEALYLIYSEIYRAPYYKRVLKLKPRKNYYEQEFLDYVKRGFKQQTLIQDCLKPNLRSTFTERRRASIALLNKFTKAGFLTKEELINMYLEVLENGQLPAVGDAISELRDDIEAVDSKTKTKLILNLRIIIKHLEKKVKKSKAQAKKRNNYYQSQYESLREELLKVQALLSYIVLKVLSDFQTHTDLRDIVYAAAGLEGCFNLLADDVYIEYKGYLEAILNTLIETQKQLISQVKPESLRTIIANNLKGNNKDAENEQIKTQLKQIEQQIKTVSGLIKQLEISRKKQLEIKVKQVLKAKNNNGLFFNTVCIIADIAARLRNNPKQALSLLEQAI
jgi:hypothetical protein